MRKFLLALIFLFSTFTLLFAQERYGPYKIHKFVDGDTFWVKMGAGKNEKIRLIGVDTPEVKWEGLTEEQPGGKEASEYVKNMLKGKKVLLEYDVQKYDRYGRTLAYVYLEDSTFLNAHLLEMGLARLATFPPNVRYVEFFREVQGNSIE
ncbi:thermonuclease family protein [Algoriphagus sp. AGSA1]|uniref:thermonuclease family protein n=1 Tax=unclassified Algoriphagus TaxID=2641541 RepID=UPI00177C0CF8|nr:MULTISPECIES: thermonuclease family protein [unclassified Algoriphagus]MCE7057579.1 thermonuclease family protein [Algoriphagus sp. AGSA1]